MLHSLRFQRHTQYSTDSVPNTAPSTQQPPLQAQFETSIILCSLRSNTAPNSPQPPFPTKCSLNIQFYSTASVSNAAPNIPQLRVPRQHPAHNNLSPRCNSTSAAVSVSNTTPNTPQPPFPTRHPVRFSLAPQLSFPTVHAILRSLRLQHSTQYSTASSPGVT